MALTEAPLPALTSGEHAIVATSGSPNPGAALLLKVADGAKATSTCEKSPVATET